MPRTSTVIHFCAGLVAALAAAVCHAADGWATARVAGIPYVGLGQVAAYYGLGRPVFSGNMVTLTSRWTTLRFECDSRRAWYNGTTIWPSYPSRKIRTEWALAACDAETMLDPLLRPRNALAREGSRLVVLDPGHGGVDKGARGRRGVEEKRVVLDVARRVRTHLASDDVQVRLVREKDQNVALPDRCRLANEWGADVFVSIHINASGAKEPAGVETYVLTPAGCPSTHGSASAVANFPANPGNRCDSANTILGYCLQARLVARTGQEDRGVKRARFYVLKNVSCAAALVECGFVSNRREEEQMLSSAHRDAMAKAIATGISDYLAAVQRAQTAPARR